MTPSNDPLRREIIDLLRTKQLPDGSLHVNKDTAEHLIFWFESMTHLLSGYEGMLKKLAELPGFSDYKGPEV